MSRLIFGHKEAPARAHRDLCTAHRANWRQGRKTYWNLCWGQGLGGVTPRKGTVVPSQATICSAFLRSTETSWLTPCSAIVTPKSRSILLMVTAW